MADAHLEWLTSNTVAFYPFKEDTDLQELAGSFKIPKDLFLDFVATGVPPEKRYFVGRVSVVLFTVSFKEIEIEIVDEFTNSIAVISTLADPAFIRTVDSVIGQDSGRAIPMKWVWGPGLASPTFPGVAGDHYFLAELEPSVLVPTPAGVLSLSVFDPGEVLPVDPLALPLGQVLDGNVFLEEGNNLSIITDELSNSFLISAASGLGAGPVFDCETIELDPKPLVRINGQDAQTDPLKPYTGDFRLDGDECIQVIPYPKQNVLAIHNRCRPCCDCEKLEEIKEAIASYEHLLGYHIEGPDRVEIRDYVYVLLNLIEKDVSDTVIATDNFDYTKGFRISDSVKVLDDFHVDNIWLNLVDYAVPTDIGQPEVVVLALVLSDSVEVSDVIEFQPIPLGLLSRVKHSDFGKVLVEDGFKALLRVF